MKKLTPQRTIRRALGVMYRLEQLVSDGTLIRRSDLDKLGEALTEAHALIDEYGAQEYERGKQEPRLF